MGKSGAPFLAGNRGGADDRRRPVACHHEPRRRLGRDEHTGGVDLEHPPPFRRIEVNHWYHRQYAGVGDQQIDATKGLIALCRHPGHGVGVGNVEGTVEPVAAGRLDGRQGGGGAIAVDIGYSDSCTPAGQGFGNAAADAAPCAGNQGALAGEVKPDLASTLSLHQHNL